MGYPISAVHIGIILCGVKFPMTLEGKVKDCEHTYAICIGTQKSEVGREIWNYTVHNMMQCVACRTSILDQKNEYCPAIYKKEGNK